MQMPALRQQDRCFLAGPGGTPSTQPVAIAFGAATQECTGFLRQIG